MFSVPQKYLKIQSTHIGSHIRWTYIQVQSGVSNTKVMGSLRKWVGYGNTCVKRMGGQWGGWHIGALNGQPIFFSFVWTHFQYHCGPWQWTEYNRSAVRHARLITRDNTEKTDSQQRSFWWFLWFQPWESLCTGNLCTYLQYTIRSLTYNIAMATPDSYFPFIWVILAANMSSRPVATSRL